MQRPPRQTAVTIFGAVVCLSCAATAWGQVKYPCLPDADGDGQPIFGNPQVRPDFEVWNGTSHVASATSVAFADIDGDGWKDAVCTLAKQNYATNGIAYISVLKGHGDGVFDPAEMPIKAGVEPCHVALADLDFDFDVDVIVADGTGNAVVVLLNNGDGTFAAPVNYAVGSQPRCVIVADFDGDLMPDVVTLNVVSSSVSLLRGKGDGTFDPHEVTVVGNVTPRGDQLNFPYPGPFMAAGDLDGDDDLDLAIPCKTEVRILHNDGFGAFALAAQHPMIGDPRGSTYGVEIADLNNDKKLDVATTAFPFGVAPDLMGLWIAIGKGDGTFDPAVGYDVRTEPEPGNLHWYVSVSAGDIDGDGFLDLAVGHEVWSKTALVYNNGDGTFGEARTLAISGVTHGPWVVRFEHLNSDGRIDLAALTNHVRAKLCVSLNDGVGGLWTHEDTPEKTWGKPTPFPWGGTEWVETGDVDLDGDIDVVLANAGTGLPDDGSVVVMFNDGSGKFPEFDAYLIVKDGLGWPTCARLTHLNDDAWLDIVVTDVADWETSGRVWVLMATGQGAYAPPMCYVLDGLLPIKLDTGDLDGDGDVDVATWTCEEFTGNYQTPVDRRVIIFENDGTGQLSQAMSLVVDEAPWFTMGTVLLIDLDDDKALDLVATAGAREDSGVVVAWRNDGNGAFTQTGLASTDPRPESLVQGYFDGTGRVALAVLHNHNFHSELVGVEAGVTVLHLDGLGGIAGQTKHVLDGHLLVGQLGVLYPDDPASTRLVLPEVVGRVIDVDGADIGGTSIGSHGAGDRPFGAIGVRIGPDGAHAVLTANNADGNISVLRNVGCASQPCFADCDGSGSLDLFDFLCFVNAFTSGEPAADCDGDGGLTLFDFLCFISAFNAGCS